MKSNHLSKSLEKEIKAQSYQQGYDQAMSDALKTIISLLQHNDIRLKPKEFWTEYEILKTEGVI